MTTPDEQGVTGTDDQVGPADHAADQVGAGTPTAEDAADSGSRLDSDGSPVGATDADADAQAAGG